MQKAYVLLFTTYVNNTVRLNNLQEAAREEFIVFKNLIAPLFKKVNNVLVLIYNRMIEETKKLDKKIFDKEVFLWFRLKFLMREGTLPYDQGGSY